MKNINKIHKFWKEKADICKTSPDASWGDSLMVREVRELSKYLHNGDNVLDVGCANGSSSIQFAKRKNVRLLGVDYVPEMIQNAREVKRKLPTSIADRITFKVGDALRLHVHSNYYDVVISTRCICNLTSWDNQKRAVKQMWKALRPGGVLLISEPTFEGLKELNRIGHYFKLKPLTSPWHNLYVDEHKLLEFANQLFQIRIDYFSSTYYFLSRIIYRWIKGDDASKLRRNSLFNRVGILLPSIGTCGVQRLYIMKKRNSAL
ncbi:hypothetical protein A2Z00_02445 [Candidatus Gottesmanbacteria bacterium RBG_13_45_10]|uniref:Methyltransferase domain-containing protein n=1 Tax=Candidatus Gottesmanbacteria bacterium RBG_13_45_10 TaxID=1798370 RepID=A0A1F5ZG80_9BACT|nr:MAG: hypothetical protein A2Z00_02445 [Candidatus Gottesmanbacteria bacterium RBG_13_45_10]